MLTFEEILSIVKTSCSSDPVADMTSTPHAIVIDSRDLVTVCASLQSHPSAYFDMLSCITGIDNGPDVNTVEVAYNLYSIPFNHHVMLKVSLRRSTPEVDTVSTIWKTADWHERELFDMFGIHVKGHPDLRRILMPADWEGFPLLKDYKHQEYYRNIKIDY